MIGLVCAIGAAIVLCLFWRKKHRTQSEVTNADGKPPVGSSRRSEYAPSEMYSDSKALPQKHELRDFEVNSAILPSYELPTPTKRYEMSGI